MYMYRVYMYILLTVSLQWLEGQVGRLCQHDSNRRISEPIAVNRALEKRGEVESSLLG